MNVNAIFDVVNKASKLVHLQDDINKKTVQISNVLSRRCGNCSHWMKSSCIPEKKHKHFKSCESIGCCDFELDYFSKKLSMDFEKELRILKNKLIEVKGE